MLLTLLALSAVCTVPASPVTADSLLDLHRQGRTWSQFFEAANARKPMWEENYRVGTPDPDAVARARALAGRWLVLAVAEDWCGDSANTVPYLARLADEVPSLDLRIANSKDGRWVMEGRRTADGRAATPTIVVLDEQGREVGCLVERPAALKVWVSENKPKLSDDEFQTQKMAWYRNDRGRETVGEIVAIIEAASRGAPVGCH